MLGFCVVFFFLPPLVILALLLLSGAGCAALCIYRLGFIHIHSHMHWGRVDFGGSYINNLYNTAITWPDFDYKIGPFFFLVKMSSSYNLRDTSLMSGCARFYKILL